MNSVRKRVKVDDILSLVDDCDRENNGRINDIREKVLVYLFHIKQDDPFLDDTEYGNLWRLYHKKIKQLGIQMKMHFLKNSPPGTKISNSTHTFTLDGKGGQGYNFDFLLIIDKKPEAKSSMAQDNDIEYPKLIKYEYKHQPDFSSLPQFLVLSVISNPFVNTDIIPPYWQFFLQNYIPVIREEFDETLPEISIENYKKKVRTMAHVKEMPVDGNATKEFFFKLRQISDDPEKVKSLNKYSDESIREYIQTIQNTNALDMNALDNIQQQISSRQVKKVFIFYNKKTKNWYISDFPDSLKLVKDLSKIRYLDHTIEIDTEDGNMIELYLRWKNRKAILNPAWQIKLKQKNKPIKCKKLSLKSTIRTTRKVSQEKSSSANKTRSSRAAANTLN